MKTFKQRFFALFTMCTTMLVAAHAQKTYSDMEALTVNENVSTIITASEPIRLVDISTDSVAGDNPLNNVIRIKPKSGNHSDGELLGIVTIITERYRVQYALIYTHRLQEAVTDKEVELVERNAFHNPEVSILPLHRYYSNASSSYPFLSMCYDIWQESSILSSHKLPYQW